MFTRNMYLLETYSMYQYPEQIRAAQYSIFDFGGDRLLDLITCTGYNLRHYGFKMPKASSSSIIGGQYATNTEVQGYSFSYPTLQIPRVQSNYEAQGAGKGPAQYYRSDVSFQITNSNELVTSSSGSGYSRVGCTHVILGEGNINDVTPVTLDDYDISNKLFDDKITLNVSRVIGGFSIAITNITGNDITVRELGLVQCMTYQADPNQQQSLITELAGDFTDTAVGESNYNYYRMPILIAKVKLTTPVTVLANGSKTISWTFDIPTT